MVKIRILSYLAIAVTIWLVAVLGYTAAYGTILTSISMPSILPAFSGPYWGGVLPAIGFLVTAYPTVRGWWGTGIVPIISIAFTGLLVAIWFALGWEYGMKYQGYSDVWTLAILNGFTVTMLILAAFILRKHPSVWGKLSLNTASWVWIGWLAFPWLGEWP